MTLISAQDLSWLKLLLVPILLCWHVCRPLIPLPWCPPSIESWHQAYCDIFPCNPATYELSSHRPLLREYKDIMAVRRRGNIQSLLGVLLMNHMLLMYTGKVTWSLQRCAQLLLFLLNLVYLFLLSIHVCGDVKYCVRHVYLSSQTKCFLLYISILSRYFFPT
jgi:hypothetical protein